MKNVLIISSSPRRNGNSDTLAEEFARGARESGNKVKKVFLADKNIGYCTGCGACVSSGVCSQNDDMYDLIDDMQNADVVVFATPVYFYTMCGQMKTFIDRLCPAYESLGNKDYYIIATAAETDASVLKRTVNEFGGFFDCLDNPNVKPAILGTGAWQAGEISAKFRKQAYDTGKNV